MQNIFKHIISDTSGIRIDVYLSTNFDLSRTFIQNLIKDNKVFINGKTCKSNYKVEVNDSIEFEYQEINQNQYDLTPIKMDLDIVYEDDYLIVVNKPKGLVVHPGPGNRDYTLVHGLLYHCKNLSDTNQDIARPGIVHRIDKDTSGLLVCAKDNNTHMYLSKQLEDKTCYRKYYAIVNKVIQNNSLIIDAPISRDKKDRQKMAINPDGKPSLTHIKVLERYDDSTLIEAELKTGRTHQIRVHMKYINHPVFNDNKYSSKQIDQTGQYLHAYFLSFIHPKTLERMNFQTQIPNYMQDYINNKLKKEN